jgi:hypothetical protein
MLNEIPLSNKNRLRLLAFPSDSKPAAATRPFTISQ